MPFSDNAFPEGNGLWGLPLLGGHSHKIASDCLGDHVRCDKRGPKVAQCLDFHLHPHVGHLLQFAQTTWIVLKGVADQSAPLLSLQCMPSNLQTARVLDGLDFVSVLRAKLLERMRRQLEPLNIVPAETQPFQIDRCREAEWVSMEAQGAWHAP